MPLKRPRQAKTTSASKRTRTTYGKPPPRPNEQIENERNLEILPPRSAFSSFFSLPRELRDQIYHEIWMLKPSFEVALPELGNHHHTAQEHGPREYYHVFQITYQPIQTPQPGGKLVRHGDIDYTYFVTIKPKVQANRRSWILASKQMLHEAIEQFNQQATWTHSACYRGQKGRQLAAWRLPRVNSRSSRINPILLALSNAANLHVPGQFITRLYAAMDVGESPFLNVELRMDALNLLHPLVSGISGTMKLQRLSLHIHASTWWRGFEERHVVFKLKPLDSLYLPNLQLLKLSITHNEKFFASRLLMDGLREGISVLGKKMVGGNAKEVLEPPVQPWFAETSEWVYCFSRH